jgi:hypothetical protein
MTYFMTGDISNYGIRYNANDLEKINQMCKDFVVVDKEYNLQLKYGANFDMTLSFMFYFKRTEEEYHLFPEGNHAIYPYIGNWQSHYESLKTHFENDKVFIILFVGTPMKKYLVEYKNSTKNKPKKCGEIVSLERLINIINNENVTTESFLTCLDQFFIAPRNEISLPLDKSRYVASVKIASSNNSVHSVMRLNKPTSDTNIPSSTPPRPPLEARRSSTPRPPSTVGKSSNSRYPLEARRSSTPPRPPLEARRSSTPSRPSSTVGKSSKLNKSSEVKHDSPSLATIQLRNSRCANDTGFYLDKSKRTYHIIFRKNASSYVTLCLTASDLQQSMLYKRNGVLHHFYKDKRGKTYMQLLFRDGNSHVPDAYFITWNTLLAMLKSRKTTTTIIVSRMYPVSMYKLTSNTSKQLYNIRRYVYSIDPNSEE